MNASFTLADESLPDVELGKYMARVVDFCAYSSASGGHGAYGSATWRCLSRCRIGADCSCSNFWRGMGRGAGLFGLAVESIGSRLPSPSFWEFLRRLAACFRCFRLHSNQLFTAAGGGVIAGVVLVIIGVSICAVAGRRREAVLSVRRDAPALPWVGDWFFRFCAGWARRSLIWAHVRTPAALERREISARRPCGRRTLRGFP